MRYTNLLFLLFAFLVSFSGCEKKPVSGEVQEVHWDRDMCARCKMVVSERHYAVQVINMQNGQSYMFDDIGCTVLWFKEQNIAWKDQAKIWITDVDTGAWIDARTAYYDTMNITPMGYGFAAHVSKEGIKAGKQIVTFGEMSREIFKIEAKKDRSIY